MNYEESESKLHQLEEENSHLKEVVRNRNVIIQQYQKVYFSFIIWLDIHLNRQEQPKESTSTQHLSINSSTSQEDSILNRTIDKLINESKSRMKNPSWSLLTSTTGGIKFVKGSNSFLTICQSIITAKSIFPLFFFIIQIHEQNEAYKQKISYFEDTVWDSTVDWGFNRFENWKSNFITIKFRYRNQIQPSLLDLLLQCL